MTPSCSGLAQALVLDSGLSGAERLLLLGMTRRVVWRKGGADWTTCYPSIADLARMADLHPDTAKRRLRALAKRGVIRRTIRPGRLSLWEILWSGLPPGQKIPGTPGSQIPGSEDPGDLRSPHPGISDPPDPGISDPPKEDPEENPEEDLSLPPTPLASPSAAGAAAQLSPDLESLAGGRLLKRLRQRGVRDTAHLVEVVQAGGWPALRFGDPGPLGLQGGPALGERACLKLRAQLQERGHSTPPLEARPAQTATVADLDNSFMGDLRRARGESPPAPSADTSFLSDLQQLQAENPHQEDPHGPKR